MLKLDNNALIRDQAYIDGEWRGARSGERFPVKNPATGEVIATFGGRMLPGSRLLVEIVGTATVRERNHGRSGSVQTSGTMEHAEDAYARMMSGKAQFRVVLTM